jgi:hypothetical protein
VPLLAITSKEVSPRTQRPRESFSGDFKSPGQAVFCPISFKVSFLEDLGASRKWGRYPKSAGVIMFRRLLLCP